MTELATFGAGCFWGVEVTFRNVQGVKNAVVGYLGGTLVNPTYRDVCTGRTGHAEVVQVTYDPSEVTYDKLLDVFWENHDPTTLNRQGPDVGTQYRSAIYCQSDAQRKAAETSRDAYQQSLTRARLGPVTTEIREAPESYYAEDYHQQYLHKNPWGYCGIGGTGVCLGA